MKRVLTLAGLAAFLVAAVAVVIPGIFLISVSAMFGSLATGIIISALFFVIVFVVSFVLFSFVGLVVIWIPRPWAILLSLAVLAIGIVFFQPELDFLGVLGILFTYYAKGIPGAPALPGGK